MDLEAAIKCVRCDKKFSKKSNLQRHITSVHLWESGESFKCTYCNYLTKRKENLKRHSEKCLKRSIERTAQKYFKCSKCGADYKQKSSLDRHEKKYHTKKNLQKTLIYRRKCPLCPFESSEHKLRNMYFHFESVHSIYLLWENHSFASFEEFYDWKSKLEKLVGSSFVLRSKSKNTVIFNCRRCGIFKSKGTNKRRQKITGTCKINGFCPANIKMKKQNDCISVLYQSVHVGHTFESKYLKLSKEDKKRKNKDGKQFKEDLILEDDFNIQELSNEDSQDDNNNLEEKKKLLLLELDKLKTTLKDDSITSEQMDLILKTIKPLNLTVEAMKSSQNSMQVTATLNKPANTNKVKQGCFIDPLEKSLKKNIFSKEQIQNITLDLLMNQAEPAATLITIPNDYNDHTYCKTNSADLESKDVYYLDLDSFFATVPVPTSQWS